MMVKKEFKTGDKVVGFVNIRTGRRELRKGTVVKSLEGLYRLDCGVWASPRELVDQIPERLERAMHYWNKYHETLAEADRLYKKAMNAIYLDITCVICLKAVPDMKFTADKLYNVSDWTSEGLFVFNDEEAPMLVAAAPIGESPTGDRWFRNHFAVAPHPEDCDGPE